MIGASRTGGLSARFTGSKCRSRVWISLFAKPILARVADPIVGRTYERKRSDRRNPNLSLQVGGRPHMNRAAKRLGHPASIPRAIMSRSPEALALGPAVISFRRRYHCPSFGCLLNRSRDCTRSRVPPLSRRRYADPPAGASFPCSWRALRARIDVCFAKRLGLSRTWA